MFQQRRRTKQNPQQVYNHHNANGVGKKITLTYNYDQMGGVGGGVTKRSSIQSPYHHHHHHHHHNPSSNIFRCTLLVVGSLLVCGLLIIVGGGYNNAISLFAGNVGSDTGTTTSSSNIANESPELRPALSSISSRGIHHHQPLGGTVVDPKREAAIQRVLHQLEDGDSQQQQDGGTADHDAQTHQLGARLRGNSRSRGHHDKNLKISPRQGKISELEDSIQNLQLQIEKFITGEKDVNQKRLYSLQARLDTYQAELNHELEEFEKEKQLLGIVSPPINEGEASDGREET